jgi:hypothetical protein
MDARPLLSKLARVLQEHRLEAILIGNAAAALNGAPVTTVDFDFLFRKTPENLRKLRAVAKSLDATIWRPNYPASDFRRLARDADLLQVDFMTEAAGVKSFAAGLNAWNSTAAHCWSRICAILSIASAKPAGRRTTRCSEFWKRH